MSIANNSRRKSKHFKLRMEWIVNYLIMGRGKVTRVIFQDSIAGIQQKIEKGLSWGALIENLGGNIS